MHLLFCAVLVHFFSYVFMLKLDFFRPHHGKVRHFYSSTLLGCLLCVITLINQLIYIVFPNRYVKTISILRLRSRAEFGPVIVLTLALFLYRLSSSSNLLDCFIVRTQLYHGTDVIIVMTTALGYFGRSSSSNLFHCFILLIEDLTLVLMFY